MAATSSISDKRASYSDSFLEALKPNRIACSILSPVEDFDCRPIPAPVCLNAPSTLSVHQFELSRCVSDWGISVIKSAKTCPFFYSIGLYWMSYSLSSITQQAILLEKLGLWSVLRRGRSVSTTMGCAWKYGQSFLAAIRRAKAACSR